MIGSRPAGSVHPLARRAKEFAAAQKVQELSALLGLLEGQQLSTVMEIGTLYGGTLVCWCRLAEPDALIVSIDSGNCTQERVEEMQRWFPQGEQKLHLVRRDSHEQATLEEVEGLLGERDVDFLFIDGDHSYEGVKKDFEMYSPFVKRGGLIALHDILEHSLSPDCRVIDYWKEIKDRYRHTELTAKPYRWGGIGVLWQG